MFVNVTNSTSLIDIEPHQIEAVVTCILKHKQVTCDELSVYFVSTQEICKLHEEYFDDPTPTDCITFPIDSSDDVSFHKILGDIFICPETAREYARNHQVNFEEELTLYLVHGLLHLLNYDDIEDDDRQIMRAQELECMNLLKKNSLILAPSALSFRI